MPVLPCVQKCDNFMILNNDGNRVTIVRFVLELLKMIMTGVDYSDNSEINRQEIFPASFKNIENREGF